MTTEQIHQIATFLFGQILFVAGSIARELMVGRSWFIGQSLKACGDRVGIDPVASG
jgi:hypothetical protein